MSLLKCDVVRSHLKTMRWNELTHTHTHIHIHTERERERDVCVCVREKDVVRETFASRSRISLLSVDVVRSYCLRMN
jgi:hypothetical protein